MIIHEVKEESFTDIVKKYRMSPSKILSDNRLKNQVRLYEGQELFLPVGDKLHTVRGGEKIEDILETYNLNLRALKRKNPILEGSGNLYPGMVLNVEATAPQLGCACLVGISYDTDKRDIERLLPYLSCIAYPLRYNTKEIAQRNAFCLENGVKPLLLLPSENTGLHAVEEAKSLGFSGVFFEGRQGNLIKQIKEKYKDLILVARTKDHADLFVPPIAPFSILEDYSIHTCHALRFGGAVLPARDMATSWLSSEDIIRRLRKVTPKIRKQESENTRTLDYHEYHGKNIIQTTIKYQGLSEKKKEIEESFKKGCRSYCLEDIHAISTNECLLLAELICPQ